MSVTGREKQKAQASQAAPLAWRAFLRGLALELDTQAGPDVDTAIVRAAGRQMAAMLTLVAVHSLEALELEMNSVLAEIGWGSVQLTLHEAERCVILRHSDLPPIGSAGEPPGTWLAPALEGLYQGWMGQQAGADPSFSARVKGHEGDTIVIRYGR
jgi:hypothetical protein